MPDSPKREMTSLEADGVPEESHGRGHDHDHGDGTVSLDIKEALRQANQIAKEEASLLFSNIINNNFRIY